MLIFSKNIGYTNAISFSNKEASFSTRNSLLLLVCMKSEYRVI